MGSGFSLSLHMGHFGRERELVDCEGNFEEALFLYQLRHPFTVKFATHQSSYDRLYHGSEDVDIYAAGYSLSVLRKTYQKRPKLLSLRTLTSLSSMFSVAASTAFCRSKLSFRAEFETLRREDTGRAAAYTAAAKRDEQG